MVSVETAPSGTGTAMPLPATAVTAGFNSATVVLACPSSSRKCRFHLGFSLAVSGDRTNKKPTYPRLSIDDLRKLIVPDFTSIGESSLAKIVATYDDLAERTFLPLTHMDSGPVRRALDDAVGDALGLDAERVATIRHNRPPSRR